MVKARATGVADPMVSRMCSPQASRRPPTAVVQSVRVRVIATFPRQGERAPAGDQSGTVSVRSPATGRGALIRPKASALTEKEPWGPRPTGYESEASRPSTYAHPAGGPSVLGRTFIAPPVPSRLPSGLVAAGRHLGRPW